MDHLIREIDRAKSIYILTSFAMKSGVDLLREPLKAAGYPTDNGFIVEKGAIISSTLSNSVREAIVNLRNELINNGVIADHGDYLEFIKNYEFSSPSAASSVVFGKVLTASRHGSYLMVKL